MRPDSGTVCACLDLTVTVLVLSVSVEAGIVVDSRGNYGTSFSAGGGAGLGLSASVALQAEFTNADGIARLQGLGTEIGIAAGRLQGEFIAGRDPESEYKKLSQKPVEEPLGGADRGI
jgi:hypothetical protein